MAEQYTENFDFDAKIEMMMTNDVEVEDYDIECTDDCVAE